MLTLLCILLNQEAHVLEIFLHSSHNFHNLREHLFSHISFENFFLILLASHYSLQDIDGLQQILNDADDN